VLFASSAFAPAVHAGHQRDARRPAGYQRLDDLRAAYAAAAGLRKTTTTTTGTAGTAGTAAIASTASAAAAAIASTASAAAAAGASASAHHRSIKAPVGHVYAGTDRRRA